MRKKRCKALKKHCGWLHGSNKKMVVQEPVKGFIRWIAKSLEFRMYKSAKRLWTRGWMEKA